MVIIGSTSDISQAFIDKFLTENRNKYPIIYLISSNIKETTRLAKHIRVKHNQKYETIFLDLTQDIDFSSLDSIDSDLIFCAAGFLGMNTHEGLYYDDNTKKIIDLNYSKLVILLNYFVKKLEQKERGTIIGLASVAGLRGRQSNFIYGSAKSGFITYLSGLRNYLFRKKIHVITVIPGFMATKMTEHFNLPKLLTASPKKAANLIYKAYKKKKNIVYITSIWWLIMKIILNIPETIFKRLKM